MVSVVMQINISIFFSPPDGHFNLLLEYCMRSELHIFCSLWVIMTDNISSRVSNQQLCNFWCDWGVRKVGQQHFKLFLEFPGSKPSDLSMVCPISVIYTWFFSMLKTLPYELKSVCVFIAVARYYTMGTWDMSRLHGIRG